MANPDYFETMQTLADVETLRQAGLSVAIDPTMPPNQIDVIEHGRRRPAIVNLAEPDDLAHAHQQYYREG